jgi:hypothetical protein
VGNGSLGFGWSGDLTNQCSRHCRLGLVGQPKQTKVVAKARILPTHLDQSRSSHNHSGPASGSHVRYGGEEVRGYGDAGSALRGIQGCSDRVGRSPSLLGACIQVASQLSIEHCHALCLEMPHDQCSASQPRFSHVRTRAGTTSSHACSFPHSSLPSSSSHSTL